MSASTPAGLAGMPALAGVTYTGKGWIKAATTGRTARVRMNWYDATGAFISTSNGADITDITTAYTQATCTATAPTGTAYVAVNVLVLAPAVAEVHRIDAVTLSSVANVNPVVRFTGYVDEWPLIWDGTDATAYAPITATSRLARMGNDRKLKSIVEEEILLDAPLVYYPLGEAEGATFASDISGGGAPNLVQAGTGAAVVFGTATGPGTDGLTAATYSGGKYLLSTAEADADWTFACFFSTSTVDNGFLSIAGLGFYIISTGLLWTDTVLSSSASVADGQTHCFALVREGFTTRLY
ncbi:MAG: hypothetical protein ACRDTJ_13250, partial [Pseudonocardiaceae bacterium]